ncbi:MAG: Gfo/Idh/MocA family oxidoreductase [Alphaproteobacteria bacterium]|nr:Gfo/Idh/MocA family oxidoreductase [Alphaproteobacteria bacterium]
MLNAAVVGLGRWGQTLVNAVQGGDKVRFVAGCTRTPAKAAEFGAKHGFAIGADYAAILADPNVQAVVLATPHTQHAEQVEAAARAGKHVFCDKPFTLTKASAEAAIAACRRAGVAICVGHNRRFLPAYGELARLVRSGELGTVLQVEGAVTGSGGFSFPPGGWRASPTESPAGGMTALGIHMVDALIGLLGPVAAVAALSWRRALEIPIDDTTAMLLRFADGTAGTLVTSPATVQNWRIQAYGTKGGAEMRGETQLVVTRVGGKPETTEFPPTNKERAELESFADAVAGRSAFPVSDADAIAGVAVLETVERSARQGGWMDVP